ncbi:FYVE, RhoGEF and PH domain-containing protein 6-like [Portunus trituberculatus]|uniref:FYVE, RhoGEF and PH domain-containing protein 6-like n=1 Tax=Portunus trituberculatus TaxID=210409 RepID=UPI001E1CC6E8|nr:FYVE, RhoGEF and PH domain-containing protein 6-like [Portunus trituberculatus]
MSIVQESTFPRGASSWADLSSDAAADHRLTIPQQEEVRRASWSGGAEGMAPESQSGSFSSRRSLALIFGSLGKGKRYARRQEMARSKTLTRPEGARPSSQFYVDLPKDDSADSALPAEHTSCNTESREETLPATAEQKQEKQQQQPQHQASKSPISPGGTPLRGVLVLPAAARQSSAYLVRARLFSGDSSPPPSPKGTMGSAPSIHNQEEPREAIAPYVVQQYGSMLAELTQRCRIKQHASQVRTELGEEDDTDSGDDEEGEREEEEKGSEAEVENTNEAALQRTDTSTSEAAESDTLTSSMTTEVLCETNQLTSNFTDPTPTPSPELTSLEKRERKIFLIAQEVMSSERVFVDVLRLLNADFRKFVCEWREGSEDQGSQGQQDAPLSPVLPFHELDKVLNYLPQLQNLNEEILSDLEVRIADWDGRKKISDVIVRKGPFLKLYSAYIREFQNQSDHLDYCCQTYPNFACALKAFESSERCTKLNLKHYMLKPVQRIPQYRLLLEEYLKYLPENHPDYVDTQTALAIVANVASHANDTMKQGTNFMKILALQDRLSSGGSGGGGDHEGKGPRYELLRPGRYLLKEGELLKLCRREMQPRYFILLSDVLLYTSFANSSPGGALRLNYELPLEGMRVETPRAEDFKNEFSVISTSRSFTLQASSAEERDEWLRALREAIADNASRRSTFQQVHLLERLPSTSFTLGKQAPVWIPDYRVTMCQHCTATFTLTFRRHHCRACGKVVCDPCSSNRAPLLYKKNKVERVCDLCFEVLQQDFEKKSKDLQENGQHQQQHEDGQKGKEPDNLKAQFRRGMRESKSNRIRNKRKVPERLMEVCANDISSQMSGYLQMMVRRSWRRGWFVLKDRVLYEYRAPQDVCALYSLPVLGYKVEAINKDREVTEDVDDCLAFQLTHLNQSPLIFQTDSPHLAEKWIQAMKDAVVLN